MLCGIITYFGFVSYRLPTVTCESQCKWFPLSKTTNKTIFQETDIQHCCGILTNTGVRCFLAATKQLYDWFSSSVRLVVCRPSVRLSHLFSCDQAALWMVFSVCLSVCLSVCPSHLFDYVPIIVSSWNLQELLPRTRVTSMLKVKVKGERSRSQRSQPNLAVSGP